MDLQYLWQVLFLAARHRKLANDHHRLLRQNGSRYKCVHKIHTKYKDKKAEMHDKIID